MSQRNLTQFIAVASTAAAWLQLLLLALSCCCCFVSSQQMHVANPYKYQQLQYQMLQHQQQQYEYQKHIQQLYLQQQIKLQQQKQQQEQIQQQLLVEQEKAEMQKLLEQQEQEKLLQQQLQEQQQQQQQQQEQEEKLLQLRLLQQKQQQHATYSMPMTLPIQMQQSPQQYEQQQQQQQQHTIFPLSVSLTQQQQLPSQQQKDARIVSSTQEQQQPQQGQHFAQLSPAIPTQSQMLQTSASLIVDDECDEEEDSSEIVQKESTEYRINITPETIQAAPQPARRHPEVISLTDPQQESESDYNIASSIAPTAETIDFWRGFIEDEVSVPAPTATALAATVPTAAAATVIAATAKATAPTSTATAAVRPTAIRRATTTAAAVTSAASLTSTGAALTSSDSTAYDTTAPAFTSSAAALTAAATAATASLVAAAPRSTVDAATTRQRKDTRPKTTKRRRKPAAVREPLAALEKEQKLYELRDRQRQEFVADVSSPYRDKSYRRPYSQSKKQDDSHESSSNAANATVAVKNSVELKNILKKSGGMSLSEILQQKNLSLDDLLKGKQTALLALQTTSATAQLQDATPVRKKKPQRRIVPTAYTPTSSTTFGASAETFNSGESESSEQRIYGKNKLKFPALQRLKLFGTSSRGAAAHSGEAATAKRRDANTTMARSTSTTTTTTTTTTKRVPIYRKRQQLLQRTTLKPLGGLLKASTSTAQTVTKAPVKILPTAVESRDIADEEFDETAEAEEETMPSTFSSSIISSSTTTTTTTTAAPIPTKSSTTSSSRRISSSSVTTAATSTETRTQANVITRTQTNAAVQTPTNTKSRTQTKYALDITNPETNSIEHDDDTPPSGKSTESGETAVTYADDDLEDFFEEATTKRSVNNSAISSSTTFPDSLVERLTPRSDRYPVKPTSDYENLPYVDPVDDRTDLLELIEDRRSGNRLFKVLEQRNMTLEELIEHRKRGSSQLHLAMVVQNRSRFFPDKKVILRDNMDIVTAFENFPHFNLMNLKSVKPDEIKTDSQGSSYFTSIIDIEPTDEIYRDGNKDAGGTSSSVGKSNSESDSVKGPSYAQLQRTEKSLGFLPPWKTLALASSSVRTANNQNPAFYLPQPKLLLDTEMENNDSQEFLPEDNELLLNNDASLSAEQIPARHIAGAAGAVDTAEAIENEVARAHDLLDLELSGHGFKRSPTAAAASMANQKHGHSIYGNMPAGIRSAIVASAAIVLTSLATFMVIFVVCRWKQHRKRKTNYMKTYNAMKSKLPMIATTTTSRQSTLHRHHIEDSSMVQSSGVQQSQSQQQQQQQQLHQPNARLFRSSSSHSLGGGMGVTLCSSRLSSSGSGRLGSGGIGTALTGSTTSLALSLQSAHYISNTKLNTMDPNSPEVQEYLFDALRKSF